MTSFIDQMVKLSTEHESEETERKEKEAELMKTLTAKYFTDIKKGIQYAASKGKREKYMNFDRKLFTGDFQDCGRPRDVMVRWLLHLTSTDSEYLPQSEKDPSVKDHLHGLKYSIWNNGKFTVVFSW